MKKQLIILFAFIRITLFAQIPTAGLQGYYPFSGNANDLSGNAQNGTVNGATLAFDRFGNANCAYLFNGTSDYISLPTGVYIGQNNYSYSLWFNAASSTNNGRIICIGENGGLCQSLTHQTSAYIFASSFNVGSSPSLSYSQSGTLPLNQWIHVVVTRDVSSIQMYVNGSLISSATPTNTNSQADYGSILPYRAVIGARSSLGASFFFDGLIDDIRIYNRVINQSEVTALFTESACMQTIPLTALPSSAVCSGKSVSLSATVTGTNTVSWYTSPIGGSTAGNGTTLALPSLTAVSSPSVYTYYAEVNACTVVPRTAIQITVNPLPLLTVTTTNTLLCLGSSATLSASGALNYSWCPNAISFSIVPTIAISPGTTTTYTLMGTDANNCLSSFVYTQEVTDCTRLSFVPGNGEAPIQLYPNPTQDNLSITMLTVNENTSLEVRNSEGKLVHAQAITEHLTCITLEGWVKGLYFFLLRKNGKILWKQKIIKE